MNKRKDNIGRNISECGKKKPENTFLTERSVFCISVVCVRRTENHFPFQLEVTICLLTSQPPPPTPHWLPPWAQSTLRACNTVQFSHPVLGLALGDVAKEVKEVLIENKGTSYCTSCTKGSPRVFSTDAPWVNLI